MKSMPHISDAEWEVMKVVWNRPSVTANEIVEALAGVADWKHRTIRTLISRLMKKGALRGEKDSKRYLFYPRVKHDECVREESRSFLQRVFDGQASPLLAQLVKQTNLSRSEIQELKQILTKKEAL